MKLTYIEYTLRDHPSYGTMEGGPFRGGERGARAEISAQPDYWSDCVIVRYQTRYLPAWRYRAGTAAFRLSNWLRRFHAERTLIMRHRLLDLSQRTWRYERRER